MFYKGFFFQFRGNGYGPYITKDITIKKALNRKYNSHSQYSYPVFIYQGNIEVENKSLINKNLILIDRI